MSIVADGVVARKGTRTVRPKPDLRLPTTTGGWITLVAVTLVALYALLLLAGMHTGRIGFIPVEGNSMSSVLPWGSTVAVLPLPPREGDLVVAVVGSSDQLGDNIPEDRQGGLAAKKLSEGKLVSTDDPNTYSNYEMRGRVVAVLPTHLLFRWISPEAQISVEVPRKGLTAEQRVEAMEAHLADLREEKEMARKAEEFRHLFVTSVVASPSSLDLEKVLDGSGETKIATEEKAEIKFTFREKMAVRMVLRGYVESPLEPFVVRAGEWDTGVASAYNWTETEVPPSDSIVLEMPSRAELLDVLLLPAK